MRKLQARSQEFAMGGWRLFWRLETTSNDLDPHFDRSLQYLDWVGFLSKFRWSPKKEKKKFFIQIESVFLSKFRWYPENKKVFSQTEAQFFWLKWHRPLTNSHRQYQWGTAIFVFSAKIGLKSAKSGAFCILFSPMAGYSLPPPWPRYWDIVLLPNANFGNGNVLYETLLPIANRASHLIFAVVFYMLRPLNFNIVLSTLTERPQNAHMAVNFGMPPWKLFSKVKNYTQHWTQKITSNFLIMSHLAGTLRWKYEWLFISSEIFKLKRRKGKREIFHPHIFPFFSKS